MQQVTANDPKQQGLALQSEDLIYQNLYSPVNLQSLLDSADTRGRIRRLPVHHLFYGLQSLENEAIQRLLPQVTEPQWTGMLDLGLWTRDEMSCSAFLELEQHLISAEDSVARKLIRATDSEHWELLFNQELTIHARTEEDEFEGEIEEGEWMETPDGNFLIQLPFHVERSRLLRSLIEKLYKLEPEYASQLLSTSRARTSLEIQETAYQNRRRRLEELGFQDYFEAIEMYVPLTVDSALPKKGSRPLHLVNTLPSPWAEAPSALLLFQVLSRAETATSQRLLEEVFFVCNKVLSADQISPAQADQVKRSIRKTIAGINLGLDIWSNGNLSRAEDGATQHYLQSFFQLGYGQLLELQQEARQLRDNQTRPEPGSFLEEWLEGLARNYPLLTERVQDKIQRRFFQTRQDLDEAKTQLATIGQGKGQTNSPDHQSV